MTRRDYIRIANAVLPTTKLVADTHEATMALVDLVETLAETLAADNPRFDTDRFIDACWGL